ncbi:hypothetical protein Dalk_4591 [Desulfatibacillum aliphaticivorans]|uniref:Uncharacterized protein n=1 Tax=Desulfatibacillum aliphaticivorans TaxID=218208 RepID=B8FNI8_DESAL|nr:hypothetical protein [Desulfatibacillum aliphaticivorans]ACL06269.1 hypothetical protein Dalk_4591 [Desulfatibacillum aliphaticivorans]
MVHESQITIDGIDYRLIDTDWSPGTPMLIHTHPEYIEPDWCAWEILRTDEDRDCWRTMEPDEYDMFIERNWQVVLEHLKRESAQGTDEPVRRVA